MISKLFLSLFVFSSSLLNTYLPNHNEIEDNYEIQYTMEDEFTDNEILVVLTNEESLLFKEYSVKDFKGIGAIKVEDLTKVYTKEKVYNTHIKNPLENQRYINNFSKILKITLNQNNKQNVLDKINVLNKLNFIKCAEPNLFQEIELNSATSPTDTYIDNQWALEKIQASEAWAFETGSSNVKVGILDSGIDCDHVDLNDNIDTSLCKYFDGDNILSFLTDIYNHGTPIAGIIGAKGDNNQGISGVCQDVTMVSLRVYDINSYGDINPISDKIVSAITYAEENNIKILNMSFSSNYYETVKNVISSYTGLVVTSAGNLGKDIDEDPSYAYPAAYTLENIITVGASDAYDNKWDDYIPGTYHPNVSNYGATKVDLFAPGDDVYSTSSDGGYSSFSGTSFAAPYVTGVAALLKSYDSTLTPLEIKQAILSNVDVVPQLQGLCVTGGRLNAYKAIESIHSHDYTYSYAYKDSTRHIAYCPCNQFRLEAHAILTGTNRCIKCNGIVNGGFIEMQSDSIEYESLNGSFILPNGIIVLVEEDVEAYLNNTLVFYKKDEDLY